MFHRVHIDVREYRIISFDSIFVSYLVVQTIDWSDALTQFNNIRLWGAYSMSKVFQILSAYKFKEDLSTSRSNQSSCHSFNLHVFS